MITKGEIIKILVTCIMSMSLTCSDDFAFMFTLGAIKITFKQAVLVNVGYFEQFYSLLQLLKVLFPSESRIFISYLLFWGSNFISY